MKADLDTKVVMLGVKPKPSPDSPLFLVPPPAEGCQHHFGPFEVDVRAGKCRCRACNGEVSPIFVLERLMHDESRWNRGRKAFYEEAARLRERSRTKCQHCGEMTRISQR